jgi:hypothetical protein
MNLKVDISTGEILPQNVMAKTETAPAIIIDISDVEKYHSEPEKLADIISAQAGFMVFDVSTDKGRKACASHSMSIIKCISPAINASKAMAEEAKKVINKDLYFRKTFDSCIREVAAYHRKPLTEYEAEQERIKDEQDERERLRIEEANYLIDWDDALDLDELFVLRKAKAEAARIDAENLKAIADKRLFDEAVIKQAETLRLQIEAEAKREAEAEQSAKLEAERAKVRAEEQTKIEEERRLRKAEYDEQREKNKIAYQESRSIRAEIDPVHYTKPYNAGDYVSKSGPAQTPYTKPMVEMVTIPKSEYDEIQRLVAWLDCLESYGVENWEGFDEAKEAFAEETCPF